MATRTIIEMYDDIDGTTSEEVKTFTFVSRQGVQYEIDLSPKNVAKLDKALLPYAAPKGPTGQGHFNPADHGTSATVIREWGRANGLDVKEQGAIPGWLGQAWIAAQSSATARSVREALPGAKRSAS